MGRLYPRGACTKGTNAGILGMQCASHPTQNIVSFAARDALAKPRLISEQTHKWINSSVTARVKGIALSTAPTGQKGTRIDQKSIRYSTIYG